MFSLKEIGPAWALVAIFLFSHVVQGQESETKISLTIGSPAPALDLKTWFLPESGEFAEVKEFQPGKIYVVEFWATWCGPCIASMPHILELQKKHAKDGVQVISISDEDLDTVNGFFEKEVTAVYKERVKGWEAYSKFGELTRNYCLASDPDESSSNDYMRGAGQNGIPCAFLVGKSGAIEWIGHPMSIDKPLNEVINDTWDRETFAVKFRKEQEERLARMRLSLALRGKNTEQQIEILNDELAKVSADDQRLQLSAIRLNLALRSKAIGPEKTLTYLNEALACGKGNPSHTNNLAWTVYLAAKAKTIDSPELIAVAREAAVAAITQAGDRGNSHLLDTIAHLYHVEGDTAAALEFQRRAVKFDDQQSEDIKAFLDELEKISAEPAVAPAAPESGK